MKQRVFSLLLALLLLTAGVPVFADGTASEGVLCYSNFDMISLQEMRSTHQEYTTGNMIADSYVFEAKRLGVEDVNVAIVSLGTIRKSVRVGALTLDDAFNICYAVRNNEILQSCTIRKSRALNTRNAIGNRDTCQFGTTVESIGSNACYAIWNRICRL